MIILNDLQSRSLVHKYMDDLTITEEVVDRADSIVQEDINNIVEWCKDNETKSNEKKTNGMIISFKEKPT